MSGTNLPTRAWLQELKQNRRTQVALGVLAVALVFMVYVLWPDAPKRRPRTGTIASEATVGEAHHALQPLDKLPNLAKLGQAGQLPSEGRMYRDLFMFEGPPPPPPPPAPPPPPPPPPTEAELKAQALQRAKDAEMASRPQDLRYLGFMERASVGRLGSFVKNEEAVSIKVGSLWANRWKLVSATENQAEFQNLKYPELRHRLAISEASGARGGVVTNEF
ncbi:MAG: hypothetical protein LWX11_10405 [Firmicutes bacterium]|nr:hypothetical protein [Bacillota bacterium]